MIVHFSHGYTVTPFLNVLAKRFIISQIFYTYFKFDYACMCNFLCYSDLSTYGFSIVHGMPTNFDALPQLIKKINFEKMTHYGTYFKVMSREDDAISNLAYTAHTLGLHLDLSYYDYVPGVSSTRILNLDIFATK